MNGAYGNLCAIQRKLKGEFGVISTFGIAKYNGKPMYSIVSRPKEGECELTLFKIMTALREFGVKGKIKMLNNCKSVSCRFFMMPY